jgi:hypothetical protein
VSVGGQTLAVGSHDAVTLRFDGVVDTDLVDDDHVPHSARIDSAVDSIRSAAGELVAFVSWQIHRDGSELFLYGPSGRALREALSASPALTAGGRVLPAE